jgi:PAS domain S-box-containing protein
MDLNGETQFMDSLYGLFPQIIADFYDGIVIVDSSLRIRYVNNTAEWNFGYLKGEMLDKPVSQLLPERLRSMHDKYVAAYFLRPTSRPMGKGATLVGLRKDGTEFPVEISLGGYKTPTLAVAVACIRIVTEAVHEAH